MGSDKKVKEGKEKKRKVAASAGANDPPAKKTRKDESEPSKATKESLTVTKKKKKSSQSVDKSDDGKAALSTTELNGQPARQIKPRKRAADFLSEEEDEEKREQEQELELEQKLEPTRVSKHVSTKQKSEKNKTKKQKTEDHAEKADESRSEGDSSEDDNVDDQTVALIKGFESSGDEDASDDEGFSPDQPVPRVPDSKKAKRKILKRQKKNADVEDSPGVVYVGRVPHGFYEHQMRAYFSQFGNITRLRLSRNRITGRSKHYAFVEFASKAVAKIVAETMDNYLLYGHILKCKYVPQEQLHPELWKGANRRFKKTPWNKIEKRRLEKGKTKEQWSMRIKEEQKRRLAKVEKLRALGYEFDVPQLKSVDELPTGAQEGASAIEAPEHDHGRDSEQKAVRKIEPVLPTEDDAAAVSAASAAANEVAASPKRSAKGKKKTAKATVSEQNSTSKQPAAISSSKEKSAAPRDKSKRADKSKLSTKPAAKAA